MAKKMDIQVIAEGVENESQDRILEEFGCDFAQGYLYSRPLPLDEFENLLVDWPNQDEPETEQNTA